MIETITTIVTPAASYDLTDLATAKDDLSIPTGDTANDAFLSRAITQASAAIANYCNRVFPAETVQDAIYLRRSPYHHRESYVPQLQLSRWPIISVSSVLEIGSATPLVQDTDFKIDAARGWLLRLSAASGLPHTWRASAVTVQYQAGYSTIPSDLVEACLRLVTARFKARGRDPMLRSEGEPGLGQQQYWIGMAPGQNGSLPPEIQALVDQYRVPVTA